MEFNVAGVDIGFRKTGIAVFKMTPIGWPLIAATTICPDESATSVLTGDIQATFKMLDGVRNYLVEKEVKALFLEFPAGGSQSGRASRCMGIATGFSAALLYFGNWEYGYEVYTPSQIEQLLGIKAAPGTKKGMAKGRKREEKKEAIRLKVLEKYPDFEGWPETKALAEDAYDAAGVFLAAQLAYGEGLFDRLRDKLWRAAVQ